MSAAAAKRASRGPKPESTRSPAQLKGLEKARAARKAKREGSTREAGEAAGVPRQKTANAVESLIELFAERWNKIGTQVEADRLLAEIESAATSLAPEDVLAYAAAPGLRGRLLSLCVFARAEQKAAMPRGNDAGVERHAGDPHVPGIASPWRKGGE
jgi:hypothetical protein